MLLLSAANTHTKKIEILQKKAARIILRQPRDAHVNPLLKDLRLDLLSNRRSTRAIKLIKAIREETCHPALISMFNELPDGSMNVPIQRTLMGKRSFGVIGAKLYNEERSKQTMGCSLE